MFNHSSPLLFFFFFLPECWYLRRPLLLTPTWAQSWQRSVQLPGACPGTVKLLYPVLILQCHKANTSCLWELQMCETEHDAGGKYSWQLMCMLMQLFVAAILRHLWVCTHLDVCEVYQEIFCCPHRQITCFFHRINYTIYKTYFKLLSRKTFFEKYWFLVAYDKLSWAQLQVDVPRTSAQEQMKWNGNTGNLGSAVLQCLRKCAETVCKFFVGRGYSQINMVFT